MVRHLLKFLFLLCVLGAVTVTAFYVFNQGGFDRDHVREKVRIGLPLQLSAALPILAVEKGFFEQESLEAEIHEYPSGKRTLENGLFAGEVDAAFSTDVPAVLGFFHRNDFSIIACTGISGNNQRIVARKDKGIQMPGDLRGKKIGTQEDSALDYFIHLFLLKEGLDEKDASFLFYPIEKLSEALAGGEVDAVVTREPYVSRLRRILGDQAVIFEEPKLYSLNELVLLSDGFSKKYPKVGKKLLRALLRAEVYMRDHRDEAVDIVSRKVGSAEVKNSSEWAYSRFRIELSHSLVDDMDNIGEWALSHPQLTGANNLPDYLNFIRIGHLQALKPEAVDLVVPHGKDG